MSQELIEFSDLIDERFEPTEIEIETDDFLGICIQPVYLHCRFFSFAPWFVPPNRDV